MTEFWELPLYSSIVGFKRFARVFFKVQEEKEKLENVQKQVKTVQTEIAQVCMSLEIYDCCSRFPQQNMTLLYNVFAFRLLLSSQQQYFHV